jgi:hypothetical protein
MEETLLKEGSPLLKEISPVDASILALLAQIPKDLSGWKRKRFEEAQARLLARLSLEAREMGEAVIANDEQAASFSPAAQATATAMKRWAKANNAR